MFFACTLLLTSAYFVNDGFGAPNKERPHQIPSTKTLDFMKKFGYIQMDDGDSEALYTEEGLSKIIKVLQKYGGINETGVFDEPTLKLMTSPRCGVPDIIKSNRQKRYVLSQQGWEKRNISYFLSNWSPRLGETLVQQNIQKALDLWGGYGRLSFYRKYSQDADIIVAFAQGYHGDSNPFDGPGRILAHAFYPLDQDPFGGDIHFDADEQWADTLNKNETSDDETDFFTVALHELGHSLGIAHSPVKSSIMFPYYQIPESGVHLGYDDILAMYDLYIRRSLKEDIEGYTSIVHEDNTSPASTTQQDISTEGNSAESEPTRTFTNLTTTYPPNQSTYLDMFPESSTLYSTTIDNETTDETKDHGQTEDLPENRVQHFPDICDGHVDSIATLREELFVFRDQYVWRFKDKGILRHGYPITLSNMFSNLPDHVKKIDAAYQRSDGNIVLFTGNVFWTYDGKKFLDRSPEPLTHYGLPEYVTELDAVQNWNRNKKTYFYKNDRFWRYNEDSKQMDPEYPQHIEKWRGVPSYLDTATTWIDGITYFFRAGLFWKFDNNWVMVTDESPLPTPTIWFGCSENNNIIMKWFSRDPPPT